jgi:hypothetical protein
MHRGIFFNIRLDEPSFELTNPSTGQEYRVACNKEKRKEKKKTGDTSSRYKPRW